MFPAILAAGAAQQHVSGLTMTRRFDIYAPLEDFRWAGLDFELSPGVTIRHYRQLPDLSNLNTFVSKEEWERAHNASHWLAFEWVEGALLSPAEVVNLVLLSLWLVKPNRTQIALRFHLGKDEASNEKSRQRLLDRFAWIPGTIEPDTTDADLRSVSSFYGGLASLCQARGRLNNALVLTIAGCWSHGWQTAIICHAAAAETILTYSAGHGLTKRLATTFACLTESDTTRRDIAYHEFSDLYSARSDITHGRMHDIAKNDRLPVLGRFQSLLRSLWQTVLSSPKLIEVLESSDSDRKEFLENLQSGYVAPKKNDR